MGILAIDQSIMILEGADGMSKLRQMSWIDEDE